MKHQSPNVQKVKSFKKAMSLRGELDFMEMQMKFDKSRVQKAKTPTKKRNREKVLSKIDELNMEISTLTEDAEMQNEESLYHSMLPGEKSRNYAENEPLSVSLLRNSIAEGIESSSSSHHFEEEDNETIIEIGDNIIEIDSEHEGNNEDIKKDQKSNSSYSIPRSDLENPSDLDIKDLESKTDISVHNENTRNSSLLTSKSKVKDEIRRSKLLRCSNTVNASLSSKSQLSPTKRPSFTTSVSSPKIKSTSKAFTSEYPDYNPNTEMSLQELETYVLSTTKQPPRSVKMSTLMSMNQPMRSTKYESTQKEEKPQPYPTIKEKIILPHAPQLNKTMRAETKMLLEEIDYLLSSVQ